MNGQITRDEWEKSVKEDTARKDVHDEQTRQINMLIQAAVSMENVTKDPDWDKLLSYLNGAMEMIKEAETTKKDQLLTPHLVDTAEIMQIKIALASLAGQKLALEWLLEIPRALKEQGKLAKEYKAIMSDEDEK